MKRKTLVVGLIGLALAFSAGIVWFLVAGRKSSLSFPLTRITKGTFAVVVIPEPRTFVDAISSSPIVRKLEKLDVWEDLLLFEPVSSVMNAVSRLKSLLHSVAGSFLEKVKPVFILLDKDGNWLFVSKVPVKPFADFLLDSREVKLKNGKIVRVFWYGDYFVQINSDNLLVFGKNAQKVAEMSEGINTVNLSSKEVGTLKSLCSKNYLASLLSFGGYVSSNGDVVKAPVFTLLPFDMMGHLSTVSITTKSEVLVKSRESAKKKKFGVPLVSFVPEDSFLFFSDTSDYIDNVLSLIEDDNRFSREFSGVDIRKFSKSVKGEGIFIRKMVAKIYRSADIGRNIVFSLRGGVVLSLKNEKAYSNLLSFIDALYPGSFSLTTVNVGKKSVPLVVKQLRNDDVALSYDAATTNVVLTVDTMEALNCLNAFYGQTPSLEDNSFLRKVLSKSGYNNPTVLYINFPALSKVLFKMMLKYYTFENPGEDTEVIYRLWSPFWKVVEGLGVWIGTGRWNDEENVWEVVIRKASP